MTRPRRNVAEARLALSGLLAAAASDEQVLCAAGALAVLDDVDPPYPPLPDATPLAWDTGLPRALDLLTAALDEATTIPDLARIATAAFELRGGGAVTPALPAEGA